VLPWSLPPLPRPSSPQPSNQCLSCTGLVLYAAVQNFCNAILLYICYMAEWKDKRRFLQREFPRAPGTQAVCSTPASRLLVDLAMGWEAAVLAHANVLLLLARLSWMLAHSSATFLQFVLPPAVFAQMCPL
jgi:hypothetical protein